MPEFRHSCVVRVSKLARHKDKGKTLHLAQAPDPDPDQSIHHFHKV